MATKHVAPPTVDALREAARSYGRFTTLVRQALAVGEPGHRVICDAARLDYLAAGGGRAGGDACKVYKMAVSRVSGPAGKGGLNLKNKKDVFYLEPKAPRANPTGAGRGEGEDTSPQALAAELQRMLNKAVEAGMLSEALADDVMAEITKAIAGKSKDAEELARRAAAIGVAQVGTAKPAKPARTRTRQEVREEIAQREAA